MYAVEVEEMTRGSGDFWGESMGLGGGGGTFDKNKNKTGKNFEEVKEKKGKREKGRRTKKRSLKKGKLSLFCFPV